MTDVIAQLTDLIGVQADGSPTTPILQGAIDEIKRHRAAVDDKAKDIATLQQALTDKDDEIDRLRGAAGAVSAGPSHADIKAEAKPKPPARAASPVDPAANEPSK